MREQWLEEGGGVNEEMQEKCVQGARGEYKCCSVGDRGLTQIQYSASRPATRHTVITTDWGGGEGGVRKDAVIDRVSKRRTACKTMHSASAIRNSDTM